MTLDEAIKHAEEVMDENLEKTKGRNASDPIAINCFECAEKHQQVAEWLKDYKRLLEQTQWIPVSERLPEESLNSVIGWDAHRERCVFVQYIDGYFQITGSDESFDIVAWMPLPEPYKAEGRG